MYGIREVLLKQVRTDYSEHLPQGNYVLDCSMGSNPYGSPAFEVSPEVLGEVYLYPHTEAPIRELVRARYAATLAISDDMLEFSTGSVGTCLTLNRMLLVPGKTVVCMAPTFSAVTDDMATYEPVFVRVPLHVEDNYRFHPEELLAAITANPGAMVYVDNPNNPTGQVFPLEDMRAAAAAAREVGSFIVLDEAYGDYMDDANSALNLVEEFDNLAVVRTFSKGFAGAGARLGYCVAQPQVIAAFHKVNLPYAITTVTQELACQSLRAGWAQRTHERVLRDKPRLLAALATCKNIKVAYTSEGVSISMLYVDDENVNLEQIMLDAGVRTVTCAGYDGLGKNGVRLNLHERLDTLIELVLKADSLL